MKKIMSIICILAIFLFVLTGCSSKKNPTLEDKANSELAYIERNLVSILNKSINGEYVAEVNSDDTLEDVQAKTNMEWDKVLEDTRKIEGALATTIVDLTTLNIESSEVSKLSDGVNNMIVAIGNEDEKTYLIELNNVYALIPTYMEKYSPNSENAFKKRLKYYIISTYVAYNDGNLEMAKTQVNELEKMYSQKMQEVEYMQNNEYNLNKVYVLIQELKQAVEANNSDLVESKYLLVIDEI